MTMSNKLNRLFPVAAKIFEKTPTEAAVKNKIPISSIQKTASELKRGVIPKELMFFRGNENDLISQKAPIIWTERRYGKIS